MDASPVVCGAVTNARIGAEGARHAPLCAAMMIHHHGNAMTMNKAMWDRSFTGAKPKKPGAPITKFTGPGILGNFNYGGFDGKDRTIQAADTTIFYDCARKYKY